MALKSIDDYAKKLRQRNPNFNREMAATRLNLTMAIAVRQLREEMGLTQTAFAQLVGKSTASIANIEMGITPVSLATVSEIAFKTNREVTIAFDAKK
ncbi:helix-turn-helix transcriptional regulator [Levilactobacillus angrenensis]|uniref:Helix-turn-helix transcriptional regulator n=1 Tax=Levilactobacillus angrenensis TaxID=2486020 RepID=A0ABW1U8M0_9LACO|nr:helix-turn-helix transcriptional regulator [Levilactobacillus angrenensis]